ncbi:MAG: efflux RND transporter permease subunit, partial [Rhodobacteraceae bacterium]|nr:efflux RND transporter permease subunit [Paracoccaceae bacterium]
VMLVSLALICLTMVLQFSSVVKSVVVMLTVPLGLIGALLGLWITGSPLGFMALLGIVSLAGVMVSHIIVLSDYIEEARAHGLPLEQALVKAGLARLDVGGSLNFKDTKLAYGAGDFGTAIVAALNQKIDALTDLLGSTATTAATCSRRNPCRSTKAFCAPIARIRLIATR